MKRREFLIGSMVGAAALATGIRPTFAQEAEATPKPFTYEFEGFEVGALRNFTATGLRLDGGMKYGFSVELFDNKDHAKDAFEKFDDYLDGYFENMKSQAQVTIGELKEVSAPKLGNNRSAKTTTVSVEGTDLEFVMMFVHKDEMLHKWFGVGLANPAEELFNLADEFMKFDDVDRDKDEEIFSLIPSLDDMPVGFTLDEEKLKRGDEK